MIKDILDGKLGINISFVLPKNIFQKITRKQSYENKGKGKVFNP
jgi:hypothetical protein